jgi:catechol 2,3-dioxygenase-like lactoylglutathione lyase family enzyme
MSIAPVHHVTLSVRDLDRSIAFYRDVLGYRQTMDAPVDRPEYSSYLRLSAGMTGRMAMLQAEGPTIGMIELIEWDPPLAETTPPKRPGDPGVFMFALEVVDETLQDVQARLAEQGVEFWAEPIHIELDGYPPFRGAVLADPDGNLIELIQLPSREEIRSFRDAMRARAAEAPASGAGT